MKVEHVLLFLVGAFLVYHMMEGCRRVEGITPITPSQARTMTIDECYEALERIPDIEKVVARFNEKCIKEYVDKNGVRGCVEAQLDYSDKINQEAPWMDSCAKDLPPPNPPVDKY